MNPSMSAVSWRMEKHKESHAATSTTKSPGRVGWCHDGGPQICKYLQLHKSQTCNFLFLLNPLIETIPNKSFSGCSLCSLQFWNIYKLLASDFEIYSYYLMQLVSK